MKEVITRWDGWVFLVWNAQMVNSYLCGWDGVGDIRLVTFKDRVDVSSCLAQFSATPDRCMRRRLSINPTSWLVSQWVSWEQWENKEQEYGLCEVRPGYGLVGRTWTPWLLPYWLVELKLRWVMALIRTTLAFRCSCCGNHSGGFSVQPLQSKTYSNSRVHGIGRVMAWAYN